MSEPKELRLQVLAGCEIFDVTVRSLDVDMVQFIATLIGSEPKSLVVWKIPDRVDRFLGRIS